MRSSVFKPLSRELKIAVAVLFAWMFLLTLGTTVALVGIYLQGQNRAQEQGERAEAQEVTAAQATKLCERALKFGPPLGRAFARYHILNSVQLAAYRSSIPSSCPKPKPKP